jgi:mRNA interferase RelE/StbE
VGAYSITIKKTASKELQAISEKETFMRLIEKIKSLAMDPRPQGAEKLAGRSNLFRIRQGNYRVVFSVDDQARVIDVIKVGHRRDVYR